LFAIAVGVYFALGTAGIDSARDVWLALTFQKGYAHLWTIPVEFTFYAWLPLVAALLIAARKHSIRTVTGAAVALIAIQQALWPHCSPSLLACTSRWARPG
ncbi:hypothetical protein CTI14_53475, partial [Methylobacterium radiotolerans]